MNAKILTAALTLTLGSASSYAADLAWRATLDDTSASTLTRDEVRADLARARSAQTFDGTRIAYAVPDAQDGRSASTLTRAQVRAELARARANGELEIGVQAYGVKPAVDAVPLPSLAARRRDVSAN
jgi:hypothetical protein